MSTKRKIKIEIKKLHPTATTPTQVEGESVGLDLYSNVDTRIPGPGTKLINTGVAIAIPKGYWGSIRERSGWSLRTPLGIKAGVIDSDFRGEVGVIMQNITSFPHDIKKGDKIAQLVFHRQEYPKVQVVEEFSEPETARGEKGFGSSD